jgi:predicted phosphoadenosine phosphosulfate sulfurtransferase
VSSAKTSAKRSLLKQPLGVDVLTAARQRIARVFDDFPRVYVSFSGGKDSGVLLELAAVEARRRGRRIGVLFVDLEAQYELTIDYVREMLDRHADVADPFWVSLPLNLRNAVSQFEPQWMCWEPGREEAWVRQPPKDAITDEDFFPFFRRRMEFEEFVPAFGEWYAQGKLTCCLVGIRSDESLNRFRTIARKSKTTHEDLKWTTWVGGPLYNAYPIYDWATEDIWTYYGRETVPYNRLYDRMHQAGLSIHQARICQPYGDDQRKGLWLFHVVEPRTWSRVVARVNGANQGALYARESGNILGRLKITKPDEITWKEYALRLLESMPEPLAEHYRNKIAWFLRWYQVHRGMDEIPDDGPENEKRPSWKRICKTLLLNDYHCKRLNFSPTKTDAYSKYQKLMKKRREQWKLI